VRIASYVATRLAAVPVQAFLVLLITFTLSRIAQQSPVDQLLGQYGTDEARARLRQELGLDEAIPVQFLQYMERLAHGDFGVSIVTGRDVLSDIGDRLPATLELITVSLALAVGVGFSLGVVTAVRAGRVSNGLATGYGFLAGAFPDFVIGLLLVYLFFAVLGWAPAPLGRLDAGVAPPEEVTGFYTIDSLLEGNWSALGSSLAHLALPALTLTIIYAGAVLRVTRSSVRASLHSEMTTFARACGLRERMIWTYVLRAALPPVVTLVGVMYGFMLGGVVLVEKVFAWGGVGLYSVQAITVADFAGVQAFVIIAALFSLLVYLLIDILLLAIDPRMRK
jgi:ABC-type dipeptide/oligopeptide/nickel transport system permease component